MAQFVTQIEGTRSMQTAKVLIPEKIYLLKFAGIKPEVFHSLCKTTETQTAFAPTVTAVKLRCNAQITVQ